MACQSCATSGVCHFGDRYETRCGAGRIEYLPCTVNGVGSSVLATDLPGKLVTLGHRIPRLQPAGPRQAPDQGEMPESGTFTWFQPDYSCYAVGASRRTGSNWHKA